MENEELLEEMDYIESQYQNNQKAKKADSEANKVIFEK